jgi:transposase
VPKKTSIVIELSDEERVTLERTSRSQKIPHSAVVRANLILLLEAGESVSAVSKRVGLARRIVMKWADRFLRKRVSGLEDAPRSGRPARFSPGDRTVPREVGV